MSQQQTKYSGRLLELGGHQYSPLFHDVFKLASVMLVVEIGQRYFLPQIYLDGVYHMVCIFFIIGVIVYHLIIDKLIGSGGPATMCCPFLGLRELAPVTSDGGESASSSTPIGRNVVIGDAPPIVGEFTKSTPASSSEMDPKPFGGFGGMFS